jgi:hypothetical protein
MALDPEATRAKVQARPRRRRARKPPTVVRPPSGDVASSGGDYGMGRARKFEHDPAYHRAVRDTYDQQRPAARRRILAVAKASPHLVTSQVVIHHHNSMVARNRDLAADRAQHDVPTNADYTAAERFRETAAFHQALADAAKHRPGAHEGHHGFFGAVEDIVHRVYGDPDAGKDGGGGAAVVRSNPMGLPIGASGLGRSVRNLGIATAEDPVGVPTKTAKGVGELAVGSVAALPDFVANLTTHPVRTAKDTFKAEASDLGTRYGQSDADQIKRFREQGAAPELADASILLTGGGAAAGRVAGAAARAGALGERAARLASEARPALRVAGNVTREQELSPNLIRATGQRAEDAARRVKYRRRGAQGIVPGDDEVAPLFAARSQRVEASKLSSRAHIRLKQRQADELTKGAQRAWSKLNKHQRQAVFHGVQGVVTPDDPVRAVEQLSARKARILAERKAAGAAVPKASDEIVTIDYLIKHAREVFTPELRAFVEGEAERAQRLADLDPSFGEVAGEARRLRPQADALGIPHPYSETRATIAHLRERGQITTAQADRQLAELEQMRPQLERDFAAQVREAAAQQGLPEPGFITHRPRPGKSNVAYTAGQGARAAGAPRRSEMALLRMGRVDTTAQALFDSYATNIRRGVNWRLVADQAEAHAVPVTLTDVRRTTGRATAKPDNLTAEEMLRVLEAKGLDPRDFALYQPGRRRALGADAHGNLTELDKGLDLPEADSFRGMSGYLALPRPAFEAIAGSVHTPSVGGRLLDKAMGAQSALLLGTSPAWLQAQVAANAFLTGFGVRGNVADIVNAQRWWHGLPEDERRAMDEMLGQGPAEHAQTMHMGSVIDDRNALTATWRAFKSTPFMQRLGRGNPMNLLFRADDAQNKFFKRAVLYSHAKREAYAKMGRDVGQLAAAQERATHLLRLPPTDLLDAIVKDPQALERQAQAALDVLGDYSRYTARERATLKRSVLFYGFLRYAVRTAFYTLPVKHPVAAALTAELANLHNDEVRDLLGGPEAPWAYSRIFFGKGDHLRSVDLARINPVSNPLLDVSQEGPKALGSLISPVAAAVADQVYGTKAFTGRRFTGHGSAEYGSGDDQDARARIFVDELASAIAPYRIAKAATQRGQVVSDDSLLFSPRPIEHKTARGRQSAAEKVAARGSTADVLASQLVPFVPKPDDSAATAQRRRDSQAPKRRRRRAGGSIIDNGGAGGGSIITYPGAGAGSIITYP